MTPLRTPEGKLIVFATAALAAHSGDRPAIQEGKQLERWPIDAYALVKAGEASFDPPEGVAAKVPPPPPKRVEVKGAAASTTASPGEKVVIDPTPRNRSA